MCIERTIRSWTLQETLELFQKFHLTLNRQSGLERQKMKITKFVHSCVLIEHEDKAVLIDPGIFSWQSGLVAVESLPKLDTVVVTHMHPDHMGEPFIKALVGVQPDVEWLAPADAHEALRGYGAINVSDQSTADIDVTTVDHAKVVPFGTACKDLIVSCLDW
ncbi:MBL fold metallo-hydrolase [Candidatus Saccharibacteria bacterium]|nr:MAG: MBL fold metallo-hydrolase [Candidatus Saccharibacteria bacterium]